MGKIKIRFAKKSELPAVNEIRKQVHKLHAKGRPDIFRRRFGKKLAGYVSDLFCGEHTAIVVARQDGTICGFAVIETVCRPRSPYNKARTFLRVTEIGVDKAHRRQGIGRALLTFIQEYAVENGFPSVELDVWEFNGGALRFYESMGFTTFRRHLEWKP